MYQSEHSIPKVKNYYFLSNIVIERNESKGIMRLYFSFRSEGGKKDKNISFIYSQTKNFLKERMNNYQDIILASLYAIEDQRGY